MKEYIEKIMSGEDLTMDEMTKVMEGLMSGTIDPVLAGSFLTALKMKKEAVAEIIAGARVLRQKAMTIDLAQEITLDTCGTGGDALGTFNISTGVAILSAAAGVCVVKHGNRSVSSKCGCADVLEALGVAIELQPEQVKACIEKTQMGFLYAPIFHATMRHVGSVRKTLGYRTIFNILGPLANPASASYQLVGVFDEQLLMIFAKVLKELGVKQAMVVYGMDGLDEITIASETKICELREGEITLKTISPEDFGYKRAPLSTIVGGDSATNAQILLDIFQGKKGPMRDVLVLNAGAALYTCQKAATIKEGINMAEHILDTGKAMHKLNEFVEVTNMLKRVSIAG